MITGFGPETHTGQTETGLEAKAKTGLENKAKTSLETKTTVSRPNP